VTEEVAHSSRGGDNRAVQPRPLPAAIRAIAFDLDNTLWDIEPVIARAEQLLREWMHRNCPRIPERFTAEDMRSARMLLANDEPQRAHDFTWLRRTALARHARECGYEETIAEAAFEVFFAARNEITPFSDVVPGLEQLRTRYRLGTLSNGNADLQRVGLAGYFSASLCARELGAAKPDPRCFARLLEALQLQAHQVVYVGDEPQHDVEGARAAGLVPIWMNRTARQWPTELRPPPYEVRDFGQLTSLLALSHHHC
jgi:FMN hydrolase / 5-amino-6-(5-phospho-D-ribitylamino)uracil phosphatase